MFSKKYFLLINFSFSVNLMTLRKGGVMPFSERIFLNRQSNFFKSEIVIRIIF